MLSSSAVLLMGNHVVSINDIKKVLLSSSSKLFHGLVSSDLNPRDHQNYASCWRISRDEVIQTLEGFESSKATLIYIKLLRAVIDAYIEKSTGLMDRIFHAWTAVFISRLWLVWIDTLGKRKLDALLLAFIEQDDGSYLETKRSCQQYYLTQQTVYSIELNAHCFIYLVLLVIEGKLPQEVLAIERFHSQSCESIFRAARAFSSGCSSGVNFTVSQFLNLTDKLSLFQKIKTANEEASSPLLRFPIHHKQKSTSASKDNIYTGLSLPGIATIEDIIVAAFETATGYAEDLGIMDCLHKNKLWNIVDINKRVRMIFDDRRILDSYAPETGDDDDESENDYGLDDFVEDDEFLSVLSFHEDPDSVQPELRGMRVHDVIPSHLEQSYFKILINQQEKYIHKSTACWLLTDTHQKLSSDRTKRVTQSK